MNNAKYLRYALCTITLFGTAQQTFSMDQQGQPAAPPAALPAAPPAALPAAPPAALPAAPAALPVAPPAALPAAPVAIKKWLTVVSILYSLAWYIGNEHAKKARKQKALYDEMDDFADTIAKNWDNNDKPKFVLRSEDDTTIFATYDESESVPKSILYYLNDKNKLDKAMLWFDNKWMLLKYDGSEDCLHFYKDSKDRPSICQLNSEALEKLKQQLEQKYQQLPE